MLRLLKQRPRGIKVAVAALIFLAISSISGGSVLLVDPSGKSMGIEFIIPHMPLNLHDFYIVGVWLIGVFGALPIVLTVGLWFGKKWAWLGSIGLGALVVTWILGEIFLFYSFGFVFFYPMIGGIGVITIIALNLPSTKQYFKDKTRLG